LSFIAEHDQTSITDLLTWASISRTQQWLKHLAVSAKLHFPAPIALHLAFAEGPVDEPAKSTSFEFPRWTPVSDRSRALVHRPTRPLLQLLGVLAEGQEKNLPLDVSRQ
jgi:hypothetical protein